MLYDRMLVALSYVTAVAGSYTALDLARRAMSDRARPRPLWFVAGGASLGLATWTMHFVAMLALDLGAPMRFETLSTIASLLVGVGFMAMSFYLFGRARGRRRRLLLAGTIAAVGVCGVHFVGMAAMRMPLVVTYDARLVGIAAFAATGFATAALMSAHQLRSAGRQLAGAVLLGTGVSAMHYIGIQAASFTPCGGVPPSGLVPVAWIAAGTAGGAGVLFLLGLIVASFDRRLQRMASRQTALLRQKEEQLASILAHLPVGVRVADAVTGRIVFANGEAERILGCEAAHGAPGVGATSESDPLARVLRDGRPVERELQLRRGTGDTDRMVEVSAAPTFDRAGRPLLAVAVLHDVTARIRAENDLRQAQKVEALGHITSGIAHDMNNLLTAILGNLDLLNGRVGVAEEKVLRNAVAATERGARLTSQLLGFSRRQPLQRVPVDVNAAVHGMRELLARTLGAAVEIHADVDPAAWPALADPTQLEVILLNLAINARDAMPAGGTIRLATANLAAHQSPAPGLPPGDYVEVAVADTGQGMDKATLARAFEPFFTTKPAGRGSGLGLSQVQGVCRQLGGEVVLETVPGRGTVVRVFLPRSAVGPGLEGRDVAPELGMHRSAAAGATILLVDDDRAVRTATAGLLEQLGARVITAGCGRTALEAMRDGPAPDAVILDYAMPGMNGDEVARRLHADDPALPILLITGYADPDALHRLEERCHVLLKPFRAAALGAALDALLPRRASEAAPVQPDRLHTRSFAE